MSFLSGLVDQFKNLPKTQEEKMFMEKLFLFVSRNIVRMKDLSLKDLGVTKEGGIYFTLIGNKELLESYLKFFPEHEAIIEEKLEKLNG